jgi:hypothetical protein
VRSPSIAPPLLRAFSFFVCLGKPRNHGAFYFISRLFQLLISLSFLPKEGVYIFDKNANKPISKETSTHTQKKKTNNNAPRTTKSHTHIQNSLTSRCPINGNPTFDDVHLESDPSSLCLFFFFLSSKSAWGSDCVLSSHNNKNKTNLRVGPILLTTQYFFVFLFFCFV